MSVDDDERNEDSLQDVLSRLFAASADDPELCCRTVDTLRTFEDKFEKLMDRLQCSNATSFRCPKSAYPEGAFQDADAPKLWSSIVRDGLDGTDSPIGRIPGHERETSFRSIQLHKKFSSPERRRLSSDEAKRKQEEKQAKAVSAKRILQEDRKRRLEKSNARVRNVRDEQARKIISTKLALKHKELKADELREVKVQEIRRKAEAENIKVREISFINRLNTANLKQEILERHEYVAQRKQEHLAVIATKLASRVDNATIGAESEPDKLDNSNSLSDQTPNIDVPIISSSKSSKRKARKLKKALIDTDHELAIDYINIAGRGSGSSSLTSRIVRLFREAARDGIDRFQGFLQPDYYSTFCLDGRLKDIYRCVQNNMSNARNQLNQCRILAAYLPAILHRAELEAKSSLISLKLLQILIGLDSSIPTHLLRVGSILVLTDYMCSSKAAHIDLCIDICTEVLQFSVANADTLRQINGNKAQLIRYVAVSGLLHQFCSSLSHSGRFGWLDENHATLPRMLHLFHSLACFDSSGLSQEPVFQPTLLGDCILHTLDTIVVPAIITVMGAITFANFDSPTGDRSSSRPQTAALLQPFQVISLTSAVSILNCIARLNLQSLQDIGSKYQTELYHILSFVLAYSTNFCPSSQTATNLLHQGLLLIGYMSLWNSVNQEMLRWGRPTILERLCKIPFSYLIDSRLKDIAIPTLISASFLNADNVDLFADLKFSKIHLVNYIEEAVQRCHRDPKAADSVPLTTFSFCNRFPQELWNDALIFYRSESNNH